MDGLLNDIIQLLVRVGPWIVFVVTASETAFFIGLLVPAEATVLVAAFMAQSGYFPVLDVALATVLGAFTGDQLGYLLGRFGGRRAAARGGRIGRLWKRHEARAQRLFQRKSILAVTIARFISFVRTLMPWFAGMTGMHYGRYVCYDLLGVLGWGLGSVAAGYLAGRSWHVLASALGTLSTLVLLVILGAIAYVASHRRRQLRALVRVALTGNIASGKSAVANVWSSRGAHMVDADELAREVVEPGQPALAAVVRRFGPEVLDAAGALDRVALRQRVFANDVERRALEAILHPEIEKLRTEKERALAAAGARLVVHVIPLLFETGLDDRFDVIVLVDAPEGLRRERLVHARGLSEEAAQAMIAAQMPAALKRRRSHYVIDNDADLAQLEARAHDVWTQLEARAS